MAKLTTPNLTSLANQTSAINTINNNFDAVDTALENTLSRDGTTPNTMGASLDMNSNRILNLPAPQNDSEPLRYGDIDSITGISGTITAPGTSVNTGLVKWIGTSAAQIASTNVLVASNGNDVTIPGTATVTSNLGVGTTSPSELLHVKNGNILLESTVAGTDRTLIVKNDDGTLYNIGIGTTGSSAGGQNFFIKGNAGYSLRITPSGTVGIGMSPARVLDITGTFGATGAATLGSTLSVAGTATLSGAATIGTTLGVTGASTLTGAVNTGTTLTIGGQTNLAGGTTSISPLLFTSGTNLTTAVAGAVEFDGVQFYHTIDTSSGRGIVPVNQMFKLTSAGSTISTIANYFGSTSNISLVSGAHYIIEVYAWFLNTTSGTVVWTLTNSAAPTSQNIYYEFSAAGGIVATAAATTLIGAVYNDTTAAKALAATGALTDATNHRHYIKITLINSTGTSLKIQATKSAGTITPGIGSYWTCRRIPTANVGTFAA